MTPEERRNFGHVAPVVDRPATDQADGVRRMAERRLRLTRVIAVTSGKGGVGKTNLAVNLSIALAQAQKRVILADLDLGLANADMLLDLRPRSNLSSVVGGRRTVEETMVAGPAGLRVVPGACGEERLANATETERAMLVAGLLEAGTSSDFLVFDVGTGISRGARAFLSAADEVIVVTTPEPTAVVDTYAVLKLLGPDSERTLVHVVVNQSESEREAERVATGIALTASKLLNTYVSPLGHVPRDPRVAEAVRRRKAFVVEYPRCGASKGVRAIAGRLAEGRGEWAAERRGFWSRILGR